VELNLSHTGERIVLRIEDDGRGLGLAQEGAAYGACGNGRC
jgi:signal transduction histidine kinase